MTKHLQLLILAVSVKLCLASDDYIKLYVDGYYENEVSNYYEDMFFHFMIPSKYKDWTRIIQNLANKISISHDKNQWKGTDIHQPKQVTKVNRRGFQMQVPEFHDELMIPKYDEEREDLPIEGLFGYFKHKVDIKQSIVDFMTAAGHVPIKDRLIKDNPKRNLFHSPTDGVNYIRKHYPRYPEPNVVCEDLTADEAMSVLAFSGLGAHHTKKVKHYCNEKEYQYEHEYERAFVYESDFSQLANYNVRDGYERYGAIAYFDEDYRCIAIYWCHGKRMVFPNEGEAWEHAKWAWRVTVIVHITAIDHLTYTHFIESNALVKNSMKYLPHYHRLRSFIKPFTYNTANINYAAMNNLINEKGMLHRIAAFNWDIMKSVLDFAKYQYKFVPIYDKIHVSMRDEDRARFPFYQDSKAYYQIMKEYVKSFVNNHYKSDAELFSDKHISTFYTRICEDLGIQMIQTKQQFIETLTNLFVTVTAFHQHVGAVASYTNNPSFGCGKIERGYQVCNKQNFIELSALVVLTGLDEPRLLDDWSHLMTNKHGFDDIDRKNYKIFKNELELFKILVENRNKRTEYKMNSFNPEYLQVSVSV